MREIRGTTLLPATDYCSCQREEKFTLKQDLGNPRGVGLGVPKRLSCMIFIIDPLYRSLLL